LGNCRLGNSHGGTHAAQRHRHPEREARPETAEAFRRRWPIPICPTQRSALVANEVLHKRSREDALAWIVSRGLAETGARSPSRDSAACCEWNRSQRSTQS